MSPDSQRQRRGHRERIVLSMMSLLILFGLLAGYVMLHASQKQEGKLGLISTSQVTISINEGPAAEPAADSPAVAEPTATSTPSRAAGGRSPGLVTEVLSTTGQADAAASASNKPDISTSAPSGAAGPQASARAATATSTAATGTGFVPPGLQPVLGGSSGGSTSGGPTSTPPPQQAGTVAAGAPTSTTVPGAPASTAVPQPTASGPAPTAVPTSVPTAVPDEVSPPGHHSHLHIDGVVGPGAYTTGGIRVSNVGPVAFNYSVSMTTSGDAAFASLLRMRIFLRAGDSCNYPGPPPSPATGFLPLAGDQVGTVLYDGNFAGGNKIGDPTVELATGDRHLEIGQNEVLCMEVFFPWTAGNAFQGLSVNGTQIFTAKSPE